VATGAALLAALCAWAPAGGPLRRLLPVAVLTLAVSVIAAPVSLLADLHQPARFWHFYAHFTPWSWMSVGALLLPVFVTLGIALCASWWLGRVGWMRALAPLLVLSALSITFYTGAEMMVVRARPLWHTLWVPVSASCPPTCAPAPPRCSGCASWGCCWPRRWRPWRWPGCSRDCGATARRSTPRCACGATSPCGA
jgi:hypothetical protein